MGQPSAGRSLCGDHLGCPSTRPRSLRCPEDVQVVRRQQRDLRLWWRGRGKGVESI